MVNFFFDSYAVIELIKGKPSYARYTDEPITIIVFNLVEVYASVLADFGEERAEEVYRKLKDCVAELEDADIKTAVKFRNKHRQRNLSYADCIGYAYARRNKLRFLTGDKGFAGLEGVEFVK